MWQLSRQNISRKLKGRTFFEPEHLPFEKKTGPRKIGTQDLCRPRRIHYHQGKFARDTKCIMNQCTTRSPMDKDVYGKKSLVPGCNTLAIARIKCHFNLVGLEDKAKK